MSTRQSASKETEQTQHQSIPALIQILGIIIPTLGTVLLGLIGYSQKKMEVIIPISITQTMEASRALIVISTSSAPTAIANATSYPVSSQADTVDVLLNNSNADAPSVQLIIKQGDVVIANLILPPGGTVPKINLPPGRYQVEARPIYPPITPQSPNCQIQWQLGESYTRDLVITSGEAVIQVQQFDLEPQEICPTKTSIAQTPAPGQ
jgi:hypothetical protein